MTTTQLFFATGGLMVTLFGIVLTLFYKYLDAKFESIDKRFTAVDGDLKFMLEHVVDHSVKVAMLEERTKKL